MQDFFQPHSTVLRCCCVCVSGGGVYLRYVWLYMYRCMYVDARWHTGQVGEWVIGVNVVCVYEVVWCVCDVCVCVCVCACVVCVWCVCVCVCACVCVCVVCVWCTWRHVPVVQGFAKWSLRTLTHDSPLNFNVTYSYSWYCMQTAKSGSKFKPCSSPGAHCHLMRWGRMLIGSFQCAILRTAFNYENNVNRVHCSDNSHCWITRPPARPDPTGCVIYLHLGTVPRL